MRAFTTGGIYLNFTHESRVRDAYDAKKYVRLVELKEKYDPENLFSLNQNIKPASFAQRSSSTSGLHEKGALRGAPARFKA